MLVAVGEVAPVEGDASIEHELGVVQGGGIAADGDHEGHEIAAQVTGINIDHYVRMAFLLSGMYAGLAGALYAQWNRGVSPDSFTPDIAMFVLVYVVVGGLGKLSGAIIGTFILVLLPELLIPLKEYELLIYAVVFFLVIRFMSEGIVGTVQDILYRRRIVKMQAAGQYSQG